MSSLQWGGSPVYRCIGCDLAPCQNPPLVSKQGALARPFQLLSAALDARLTSEDQKMAMRLRSFQPFRTGIDDVLNDPRHWQSWCTAPQNAPHWVGLRFRRSPPSPQYTSSEDIDWIEPNKSCQNKRAVPPPGRKLLSTLLSQFNARIAGLASLDAKLTSNIERGEASDEALPADIDRPTSYPMNIDRCAAELSIDLGVLHWQGFAINARGLFPKDTREYGVWWR